MLQIFFGFFALLSVLSALGVVFSKKSIYSVLLLIFLFFNIACEFLLIKAEFISMLMLVVYIGAVTVLFLFFVMMVDVEENWQLKQLKFLPPVTFMIVALLIIFTLEFLPKNFTIINSYEHAVSLIGSILYTDFAPLFYACGMLLLIVIIASITLMHDYKDEEVNVVRKQSMRIQMEASKINNLQMININFKEGVKDE